MTNIKLHINIFSENLKFLRKKRNISQAQLAKDLNMSQSAISQYEKKESIPTLENILDICQVFCIKIDDILKNKLTDYNLQEFVYDLSKYSETTGNNISYIDKNLKDLKRFANNDYYCYYYDSDDKKNDIRSGKLSISDVKHPQYIEISAQLSNHTYLGQLQIFHNYVYIKMENYDREEQCLIMLPYQYTPKKYVGGLGCGLSISTGYNVKPCYQHILISDIEISYKDLYTIKDIFEIHADINRIFFDANLDNRAYNEIKHLKHSK